MHPIKIENFRDSYPHEVFPPFRTITVPEAESYRLKMARHLALSEDSDGLTLVRELFGRASELEGVNAEDEGFVLTDVFGILEITPKPKVFINWYRFDDIDEMAYSDLCKWLPEIWYPGPDDIDIFDESVDWVISIIHDGTIRYLHADKGKDLFPQNRYHPIWK